MSRRLIRALQRGGVVAEIDRDRWGVWRHPDRRGRMIGMLDSAEIDVLRMRQSLRLLGDAAPPILVWSGPQLCNTDVIPDASILESARMNSNGPLIGLILARCHDPCLRHLIRDTAQRYRVDVECASRVDQVGGMNWHGLALGGRIDGGRTRTATEDLPRATIRAAAAIRTISEALGAAELDFLDRLILGEDSRVKLAKRYALRPALIERRALSSLRSLHEVYQTRIGPPL